MASQAPQPQLPPLYQGLEPVSSNKHADWNVRVISKIPQAANMHAIPATVDEFVMLQRHFPIIFSAGDNPVPLVLMGLNEGVNCYLDEEGGLKDQDNPVYMPAYMRRYPFMLARLRADSDELSLCVDPTMGAIGEFDEGDKMFVDGQPSEMLKGILGFCEQFETAGRRTQNFMDELKKYDLLMDGEVAIQAAGLEKPFVYRGFQMVDEKKLRELSGDKLRKLSQDNILPLIFAHLFSLSQIRELFTRQVRMGKGPVDIKALEEAQAKAPAPQDA